MLSSVVSLRSLKNIVMREFMPFLSITSGTLLVCLGLAAMVEPYRFAGSGVTGIALIPSYLWGLPPVYVIAVANAALLLWGWKALSKRFALWTLYNTLLTTLVLPAFESVRYPLMSSPILAALFGGVISGLGMGIMFRDGGSSGGMDVVAAVAKKRWGVEVGAASFFVNVAVLLLSLVAVSLEQVLLGGLYLYVESEMIDTVLNSFDRRTQMTVVSARTEEIVRFVLESLDRTATLISAQGAYRRTQMNMIMIVLTRRQSVELKRFVKAVDPTAFVIMGEVSEVLGEGFKKWDSDA